MARVPSTSPPPELERLEEELEAFCLSTARIDHTLRARGGSGIETRDLRLPLTQARELAHDVGDPQSQSRSL